jgi:hypothetical protein
MLAGSSSACSQTPPPSPEADAQCPEMSKGHNNIKHKFHFQVKGNNNIKLQFFIKLCTYVNECKKGHVGIKFICRHFVYCWSNLANLLT